MAYAEEHNRLDSLYKLQDDEVEFGTGDGIFLAVVVQQQALGIWRKLRLVQTIRLTVELFRTFRVIA